MQVRTTHARAHTNLVHMNQVKTPGLVQLQVQIQLFVALTLGTACHFLCDWYCVCCDWYCVCCESVCEGARVKVYVRLIVLCIKKEEGEESTPQERKKAEQRGGFVAHVQKLLQIVAEHMPYDGAADQVMHCVYCAHHAHK